MDAEQQAVTDQVEQGVETLSLNESAPAAPPTAPEAAAPDAAAETPAPAPEAPNPAPSAETATPALEDDGYQEPSIPDVEVNGTKFKALADGQYDVIILSTGLNECVLAGLLSVRGLRVLQIDRNGFYGGSCASLNLKEMFEQHGKTFDPAVEQRLGRSRDYCVDAAPKLLMAGGKLVKMLIQTGVTRYIDFNGIAGSFVFNSGKLYKLPVTPTEALTSSLVAFMQKNALRKFAEYVRSYRAPKRMAGTLTSEEFKQAIVKYYEVHNKEKVREVDALIQQFNTNREVLVSALEKKYGLPVFEETVEVEFGPGSLGLKIEGRPVKKGVPADQGGPVQSVVVVTMFLPAQDGSKGPAEKTGKVALGDIISHVNGESVLGLSDKGVQEKIVSSARPMKITFMKPVVDMSSQKYDLLTMKMRDLYKQFGLDETTQNFIGHAMALHTDDSYLDEPAEPTILACQLYGRSMGRYGQNSPYLFPNYGLSTLPEGFSRLGAIYGSVIMLRTDVDEILFDASTGKAAGVRVGDQAATAKVIIGDASYFPPKLSHKTGQVVRSVCILKHPLKGTTGDSAQIILPAKHLQGKKNDVYISALGSSLHVCPKGIYLAIASTVVETNNPVGELSQAFALMGDIEERFDTVTDTFGPVDEAAGLGCFVTNSLDASSHFETCAQDIMRIYRAINGKELNLDEKLVEDPNEQ